VDLVEVSEGRARILVPDVPRLKGPGRKHSGFYNPLMAINRDVSVIVLAALAKRSEVRRPLDGMAGTGIRGVRWALEVPGVEVGINEPSRVGAELVRKNVELNGAKASVYATGVASAAMEHKADFVDIDPFGSPVPFFFPVVQNIRKGYVSVTATDTAALTGTIPRVTARRYHAIVARSSITHEIGLRTLIGALIRDAARVDRELIPVLSYYADHYYRCYFRVRRNAIGADKALAMVSKIEWEGRRVGPMWAGSFCERELMESLRYENWPDSLRIESPPQDRLHRLLGTLAEESIVELDGLPVVGFHRVDNLAQETRTEPMSPTALIDALESQGHTASRTHFDPGGVRTNASQEDVLSIVRSKGSPAAPKAG